MNLIENQIQVKRELMILKGVQKETLKLKEGDKKDWKI